MLVEEAVMISDTESIGTAPPATVREQARSFLLLVVEHLVAPMETRDFIALLHQVDLSHKE